MIPRPISPEVTAPLKSAAVAAAKDEITALISLFDALLAVSRADVTLFAEDHVHALYSLQIWASPKRLPCKEFTIDGYRHFVVYRADGSTLATVTEEIQPTPPKRWRPADGGAR